MLVYFHIDELARDAVVAAALKHEVERVGGKLVYGNRFITDYFLRYWNIFDAIILPSLLHYVGAFRDPESLPNNVFILQTEAIGQATGTLKRLNGKYFGDESEKYRPWHSSVLGYLLWGYAHLNSFTDFHPEYLPKCRVVGHPRLSKLCRGPKRTRSEGNPVVGFVSRFNLLSPFDGRTPFESVANSMRFGKIVMPQYEGSGNKDVEDMFYTEVIDFRVMLQIMMTLDTEKFELSVRPHPRENRLGWVRLAKKLGLKIRVSRWDIPFSHWLQELNYIITPPSTGLYDIFFHGKKPIVIDNIVPTRADHILAQSDDNNQILDGVCRPRSVAEVVELLKSGKITYDVENVNRRLYEQVGADIAANSIENIVNAVQEFVRDIQVPRKPMNSPLLGYYLWWAWIVFISQIKAAKAWLQKRTEQGASFNLTLIRVRWINRLVSRT